MFTSEIWNNFFLSLYVLRPWKCWLIVLARGIACHAVGNHWRVYPGAFSVTWRVFLKKKKFVQQVLFVDTLKKKTYYLLIFFSDYFRRLTEIKDPNIQIKADFTPYMQILLLFLNNYR